ncbi:MAG: tetratricopeptide repeat protein [Deltaproteobacteria bacterium]|nr:tetratricopeptide repeat protein [Deltaproteobacteria bacterium]
MTKARKAGPGGAEQGAGGGLEQSFLAAMRAAESSPQNQDAWDHLEELADQQQRSEDVARLYCQVLEQRLPKETWGPLAERAVRFHEEWFGDSPAQTVGLLGRIIELDPGEGWAFERMVVMLTAAEQWDELLRQYDRVLGLTRDRARRERLLEDAAQVAKDFADQSDRAADYLRQLVALDPANQRRVAALERLLERQQRWSDLVELWRALVPELAAAEARQMRLRIASVLLDQLGQPGAALEELRRLLSEAPGDEAGCAELERVLEAGSASAETRSGALNVLRRNYLAAGRHEDVVRVLERALGLVEPEERRQIRRECATRLATVGRDAEAMGHYATLLSEDPTDTDARRQLRLLGQRSGRNDLRGAALVAAAEAAADGAQRAVVLLEAARLHRDVLADADGAIALYERVLATEEAEPNDALGAARELGELYAASGRAAEQLGVLERLAALERTPALRRQALAEAARLAERLGDVDRALASYRPLLGSEDAGEPPDGAALAAVVALLERSERWPELVATLDLRARTAALPQQSRADSIRQAELQAQKLGAPAAAIALWLRVREEFGEDAASVAALDELMAATGRWRELGELLGGAARRQRGLAGMLLTRFGDILRLQLDEPARAAEIYAQALGVDPANGIARAGLLELLGLASCRAVAAPALGAAFELTDDWQKLLEIVEPRLEAAADPSAKLGILLQTARLSEERADDPARALAALARALPLEPGSVAIEHEIARLAERTGLWAVAARALGEAAAASAGAPERAAELHRAEAQIWEARLGDAGAALAAYEVVVALGPQDAAASEAVARSAAALGRWPRAAQAAVSSAAAAQSLRPSLRAAMEAAADGAAAFPELADAMSAAVQAARSPAVPDGGGALAPSVAREIETTIALWYRDRCGDLDAAELAASRAAALDPHDRPTLELLAELRRRAPGPALVETLLGLDELAEGSLAALHEAAQHAMDGAWSSAAQIQSLLERLYRKAGGLWIRAAEPGGEKPPAEIAAWALDRLVGHLIFQGDAQRALYVLGDGARLPLGPELACRLRRRAAEMLESRGEELRAIEVYRSVLDSMPDDVETLGRLGALCEKQDLVSEALAWRLRELGVAPLAARRIELRLECSRLAGVLESRGGRVESLRANLAEAPGHAASIRALYTILDERGRHGELCALLEEQARALEQAAQGAAAAELWSQAAALAEARLRDARRAVAAHERVVELEGALAPEKAIRTGEALDALARLYMELGESAAAAAWLERRLARATDKERVPVLLRLSRARLQAEQREQAVTSLEAAFAEAPRNAEVRKLLISLHRKREDWPALARMLAVACEHSTDEAAVLGYAREAAQIFHERLGAPEQSVGVLRRAVALAPEERGLKAMLADGLRAAGELDEARALLLELTESFGRRRSPERAGVHLQLARVLRAQGDIAAAIEQLDEAAKMDAGNVAILLALAELAREAGQLERAERAYRTLLIHVRRAPAEQVAGLPIGPAGVLLELRRIAAARGQPEQAAELEESAVEALTQNDAEAPQVQRVLREQGESELLRRVLDSRLGHVRGAHKRAAILGELAQVLDGGLGKPEDAFEACLRAVESAPDVPAHHQGAWDLGARLSRLDRYGELVRSLCERTRRDTDALARCELLLRHGELCEKLEQDLEQAAACYEQAAQTGVRQPDAWRAAARVAGARGRQEEQIRLLEKLAGLGEAEEETRTDALYRIAEVRLASGETLAEGIDALARAWAHDGRAERAAPILRRAVAQHEHDGRLLDLYEQVARRSGDGELLVDYLERRAAHPEATLEQAREAAALVTKQGRPERAEALMLRAVEIAQESAEGMAPAGWALCGLAEARKSAGDVAGAVKWLAQAAEVAAPERVFALGREIAALAGGPEGDLTLAAKLYEGLLDRYPTAREAWEPLGEIYRRLGRLDQLERMVTEILDGLQDPGERNSLRIELARALLAAHDRAPAAVSLLKDVLAEDPERAEAQELLCEHLDRTGDSAALVELLRRQLAAAQERGEVVAIKAAALRLGARIEEGSPGEALAVYRGALRFCEQDRELLRAVLRQLHPEQDAWERAEIGEKLLAVEEEGRAAALAMELARLYESMGDGAGARRALELGYAKAPGDEGLAELLLARCRADGDCAAQARLLVAAADRAGDEPRRLDLWKEAASVCWRGLADPARAAELLGRASAAVPGDAALRIELATALGEAGDRDAALRALGEGLDQAGPKGRLALLRARGALHARSGDEAASLADLEQAYAIDRKGMAPELEAALAERRRGAGERGDAAAERAAMLRTVELVLAHGRRDEASELLASWVERQSGDLEALRRLRDIDTADGRWEGVARSCAMLVEHESGPAQIDAALALAHACHELALPAGAREGLERAHRDQPENALVRAELRKLYEAEAAHEPLARLLVEEAPLAATPAERAALLTRAAQLWLDLGATESAIPALKQVLELQPGDAATTAVLAGAYVRGGRIDDADRLLDQAIAALKGRRVPALADLQHRKAHVAAARGDRAAQLQLLQQAHLTAKQNGQVAADLADLAEELGQWDLAARTLRTITLMDAAARCPIPPVQAYLRQAKIAQRLGDPRTALMWARRAQREDPESEEIVALLRELGTG